MVLHEARLLISVVVPVFNVAPYLRRCIDSLLAQTFRDFELILVDDGSTDGSSDICDEYEGQVPCVRAFHYNNSGVSAARNRGIEAARGEYLSFVDADDWVEDGFLQAFADEIERQKAEGTAVDMVVQGYVESKGEKHSAPNQTFCLYGAETEQTILKLENLRLLGIVWNKVFRKEIIEDNDIKFDTKVSIGEDMLFVLSYLHSCKNIAIISNAFYRYENRENSAIGTEFPFEMWERQSHEYMRLMRVYKDIFPMVAETFAANQFFSSIRAVRISYRTGVERNRRRSFIRDIKAWAKGNKAICFKGKSVGNMCIGMSIIQLPPLITDVLLSFVYLIRKGFEG